MLFLALKVYLHGFIHIRMKFNERIAAADDDDDDYRRAGEWGKIGQ